MKFSCVEIRFIRSRDKWEVTFFDDLGGDKINENQKPNNLGFYYYPSKMGREKAFKALRTHLIKTHEKEIKILEKSLRKLKKLKIDNT